MKVLTATLRFAGGILALASAVCGTADWAAAQPTEQQVAAIKSACRSDYMSYCWSVPRGGAEALQCLKKNVASLSAPCQQAVKAATTTAAVPSGSGTTATAAKPAAETKPAAATTEPASAPSPTGTENAATSAPAATAASATGATTQSSTASTATQGSSAAAATSQAKAVAKKPSTATSNAQGASSAAAASAPEAVAKAKPAATQATAPVTPAATGAPMPSALGFIPPRKKFMLARACRADFNAHCPGVDVGGGRAISCLEDNMASLAPECRDALVKLGR